MKAVEFGFIEIAGLLISDGADVKARDGKGSTALQYAAFHKRGELSALLRKHGAQE
jgi:ankyrin repeat protein